MRKVGMFCLFLLTILGLWEGQSLFTLREIHLYQNFLPLISANMLREPALCHFLKEEETESLQLQDVKEAVESNKFAAELMEQENAKVIRIRQEKTESEQKDEVASEDAMVERVTEEPKYVKKAEVTEELLNSYEELVRDFYTIDSNTSAGQELLDTSKLLNYDCRIRKEEAGPQILIYHTHSQEGFADSVPGDCATGIVGVGEYLTSLLEKQYGFTVLHLSEQYDVESRDHAYGNALPRVEAVLEENPSIQVVIDLHRDEMPEETRLVWENEGKSMARFMFFNGLSRTKKTGDLEYLYNPYLEENLAFSLQMKVASEEFFPGLARKNYLKGYRYNMHLCPRTLLIELGAQNNTLEEARNACEPLAFLLNYVLEGV